MSDPKLVAHSFRQALKWFSLSHY